MSWNLRVRVWVPAVLMVFVLVAGIIWWFRAPAPEVTHQAEAPSSLVTPELALDPQKRVEVSVVGEVRDAEGVGLRAQVCAFQRKGPLISLSERRREHCVETGADGQFTFDALTPALWELTASARGFVSDRAKVLVHASGELPAPVVITLVRGVESRGRVIDIAGGIVAGARVRAGGSVSAPTDEEGRFRIWTRPGRHSFSALAEGYFSGFISVTAPATDVEVILTPGGSLAGQVIRADDGAPLPGVGVHVLSVDGAFGSDDGDGGLTVTDAEGRFSVDRLRAGRFSVVVQDADWEGRVAGSVGVDLFASVDGLVVEASPRGGTRFSGRLLVEGGGSAINCAPMLSSLIPQAIRPWIRTGPDGQFEGRAPPGEYTVKVGTFCDYELAPESGMLVLDTEDRADLTWKLIQAASIAGIVVDESGSPVPDTLLLVSSSNSEDSRIIHAGDGGEFEAKGLSAGEVTIDPSFSSFRGEPVVVNVAEAEVKTGIEVVVARGSTLSGVVVDGEGSPVAGVKVSAASVRSSAAETAGDGSFRLAGLSKGNYALSVSTAEGGRLFAPGSADDVIARVEIGGADVEVELVVEQSRGAIRGTVTSAQGPVSDAYVTVTRQGTRRARSFSWERRPAVTDVDGSFTIAELPDGAYTVRAFRRTGGEAQASGVALGDAVELEIKTPGSLAGRVLDAGGEPMERFDLRLSSPENGGGGRFESFVSRDGSFEVTGLAPGEWTIRAVVLRRKVEDAAVVEAGTKTDGLELRFEPGVRVTGRVVDMFTGEPVAGASVRSSARTETDQDGRFTLEDVSPGKLTLSITQKDQSMRPSMMFKAEVPTGESIDLGDIAITSHTMDLNETPGDFGFEVATARGSASDAPVTIERVRPGGPAAQAGLRAGQTLTHVHGRPLSAANANLLASSMRVPEGGTLTLTPEGGEPVTLVAGPPR